MRGRAEPHGGEEEQEQPQPGLGPAGTARPVGGGGGGGRRSGGADRSELAGLGAAVPEDGGGGAGRCSGQRELRSSGRRFRARPFLLLGFRAALQRASRRWLRAADPEVPQPLRGPDRHAP